MENIRKNKEKMAEAIERLRQIVIVDGENKDWGSRGYIYAIEKYIKILHKQVEIDKKYNGKSAYVQNQEELQEFINSVAGDSNSEKS